MLTITPHVNPRHAWKFVFLCQSNIACLTVFISLPEKYCSGWSLLYRVHKVRYFQVFSWARQKLQAWAGVSGSIPVFCLLLICLSVPVFLQAPSPVCILETLLQPLEFTIMVHYLPKPPRQGWYRSWKALEVSELEIKISRLGKVLAFFLPDIIKLHRHFIWLDLLLLLLLGQSLPPSHPLV